jgi:hypothetical protein
VKIVGSNLVVLAERVHTDRPGICWELGVGTHRYNTATHLSVGRPIWWKPTAGRLHYNGITEWRAGWLFLAVQVARKPQRETAR